jgi:hypothetical protein
MREQLVQDSYMPKLILSYSTAYLINKSYINFFTLFV